jgi:hypothetical protein
MKVSDKLQIQASYPGRVTSGRLDKKKCKKQPISILCFMTSHNRLPKCVRVYVCIYI